MKQNRFLSIVLIGLTILGVSVSLNLKAAEFFDVGEESFASSVSTKVGEDGEELFNVVDSEGNVLKDLSEDELQALKNGQVRTLKSLASELGKEGNLLSKVDAQAFLNANKEMNEAVESLKNENLNLARKSLSGNVADIDTLKGMNRANNVVDRLSENMKSMDESVSKNITKLAKDSQLLRAGKMELKSFIERYKRMASSMDDEAVGRLQSLRETSNLTDTSVEGIGKDVKTKMTTKLDNLYAQYGKADGAVAQKAIMDQILAQAKDIAVTDGMKGAGDLQASLLSDAKSGLGGYDKQCMDVLQKQVGDIDTALKNLKPDELDGEISTGVKDAEGHDIKITKLEQALNKMRSAVEEGSGTVLNSLKSDLSVKIEQLGEKVGFTGRRMAGLWYRDGALGDQFASVGTYLKSITRDDIAEGFCSAGKGLKKFAGKVGSFLEESGKLLLNGVGFMIPNIFQSAFLAQKQRQVELQTLASPIKFGDWVFQIPDSCFDFDNPPATLPIYVRIPVQNTGDVVSQAMSTQFNQAVSGPTSDNKVSAAIHTAGATIVSFGANLSARPKRYKLNEASYLAQNPGIILAFFAPGGYQTWGSVPLTSSEFTSGQIIDVSTGMVIDGSDNLISATGVPGFQSNPCIPVVDWHAQQTPQPLPPTLKDFLATMQAKLSLSGDDVKYIQYTNVASGSSGADASSCLQRVFDCSCLNPDSTTSCNAAGGCVISSMLDAYKTGDFVNTRLLGSVIPLFGWGSTEYPRLINATTFPGSSSANLGETVAAKVNVDGSETLEFADPEKNYSAEGCWVYLAANTPFAQALQNGSSDKSVTGPYVDYIIFLDENNTQIPFMVPVQEEYATSKTTSLKNATTASTKDSYGYHTTLGVNPDIKWWTSITAFNSATSQVLPAFADGKTGNPIKYDLQGNAYEDPSLAGPAKSGGIIALAINDLQNFPKLYQQFTTHQNVMLDKINNGPFNYGNIALTISQYNIATTGTPALEVPLYSGSHCFGSSTDDLLVALDENNNYLTLPNPNVATFYSLITDVGYAVTNQSLVLSDVSQAAMLQLVPNSSPAQYSLIDTPAAQSTYNVLDNLLNASLISASPLPAGTTSYISNALNAYVVQQRNSWSELFDSSVQKQGITVGSLLCTMPSEFHSKAAVVSNCFIYEIAPNPSAALCDYDLFILTNSAQPTLSSLSAINAQNANAATYAVSLVTGFVFDMKGNQVMQGKVPLRLATAATAQISSGAINKVQSISEKIYDAITQKYDFSKFAKPNFIAKYKNAVKNYEQQMHRPMGPYKFGSLRLGIFAGDDAVGNYVYFSAKGMHQENFSPTDVFITYDGASSYATALNSSTKFVVSLISGNVYDATGNIVNRIPSAELLSQTQTLEGGWGNWLKNSVKDLQEDLLKKMQAEQNEQQILDDMLEAVSKSHDIYMTKAAASSIIARLTPSGSSGLPAPYGLLKQDPVKQIYVYTSPLTEDEADGFLYMFFDIGTEKVSKESVGGVFTDQGHLVHMVTGSVLQVMKNQFGVIVQSDGTQKLGIPLTQPFFKMAEPESTLILGKNSEQGDLISSQSSLFPGGLVSLNKGLYLYYSTIMKNYYVYDTSIAQWLSCVGGHVYDKKGAPVVLDQKVAKLKATRSKKNPGIAAADDMILLYENSKNNMQGYMSNGKNYLNVDQANGTMSWVSVSGNGDTLQVTANENDTTYTVVDAKNISRVYQVASKYVWHSLFAVPIDIATGSLTKFVEASYKNAQLVMLDGEPTHVLFHDVMYSVALQSSNVYTMTPVDAKNKEKMTLAMEKDINTGADYIQIHDGKNHYNYLYVMDSLDEDAQSYYRSKIQGTTSPATHAFAVGPMSSNSLTVGGKVISVSAPKETTHVLFVKDIPQGSSGLLVVAPKEVQDVPTGPESAAFYANFTDKVLSSTDGRFFVQLPAYVENSTSPLAVPYVSNGAYLDLYTGVLYDLKHGISLGYCVNLDDWLAILNHLGVSVINVPSGKKAKSASSVLALQYRSAQSVNVEIAQLEADAHAEAQAKEFAASMPSLSAANAAVGA